MVDARHFLQEEHPAVIAAHIATFAQELHYIKQVFRLRAEHMVDARHFLQEEHPAVIAAHIATFAQDIAQQSKRATP